MRDLMVLGTDVQGEDTAEMVERINAVAPAWTLVGYIAPDEETREKLSGEHNGYTLYGPTEIDRNPTVCLVPSHGGPRPRHWPVERMVTFIDPSAVVARTAQIGRGCVIYPHCFIGQRTRLGDYVLCLDGCVINHDNVIGDRTLIATGVRTAGYVSVGEDCYLGQSCTIRQYLTIGCNSLIGMGAVVIADVIPNSVMVGNPARRLRDR